MQFRHQDPLHQGGIRRYAVWADGLIARMQGVSGQSLEKGQHMSAITRPFAVQRGEGKTLPTPTGDTAFVKADTASTNGSLTVVELVVAPKQGPALHVHRREDELWYVLDGEFRFKAGDEILRASTGGMAFGPRGTPHCFQNVGDETGRLLVITTPSGLERFFEEFARLTPDVTDDLVSVAHRSWIDFVGPPVAESDPL